jgi:hypothetical protein
MEQDPIPPFPEDVTTAPLLRISLFKLLAHDTKEEERLWRAACDLGFFYLDLRKSEDQDHTNGYVNGDDMLGEVDELFDLGRRVLGQDEAEKRRFDYAFKGNYFGYVSLYSFYYFQSFPSAARVLVTPRGTVVFIAFGLRVISRTEAFTTTLRRFYESGSHSSNSFMCTWHFISP